MKTTTAMNILALILGFSLLFAVPLLARENTDVIIMKNGDHLTGQIKGVATVRRSTWKLRAETPIAFRKGCMVRYS